ncbi:MAG: GNAT family N-acetyltransferase, partial [bacterium]
EMAASAHCWTTGFIKDIAVAPAYRRRGVGRALMAEIFRAFHRRGAAWVDLKVQADNHSAIAFYEAIGMVIVGE